jgi:hypothetical protein
MHQKVISVNVLLNATDKVSGLKEYEFPEVKQALDQGYIVKQVVPMKADGLYVINLTFILEKDV